MTRFTMSGDQKGHRQSGKSTDAESRRHSKPLLSIISVSLEPSDHPDGRDDPTDEKRRGDLSERLHQIGTGASDMSEEVGQQCRQDRDYRKP